MLTYPQMASRHLDHSAWYGEVRDTPPRTKCRVLDVFPATGGLGCSVIEDDRVLAYWGATEVYGDSNPGSHVKVKPLLVHYQPDVLVLASWLHCQQGQHTALP